MMSDGRRVYELSFQRLCFNMGCEIIDIGLSSATLTKGDAIVACQYSALLGYRNWASALFYRKNYPMTFTFRSKAQICLIS